MDILVRPNTRKILTVLPIPKKTLLVGLRLILFLPLLVTFSLVNADESGATAGATDTGSTDTGNTDTTVGTEGESNECIDAPVTNCDSSSPSPDSAPSNAQPSTSVGNPISLVTGNKFQRQRDYYVNGSKLEFSRHYNSSRSNINTGLGRGWSGTFGARIYRRSNGYVINDSSGRTFTFNKAIESQNGITHYFGASSTGGYVWQQEAKSFWAMPDGRKLTFYGKYLVRIDYPGHQFLTLYYQNTKLAQVSDEAGRLLQFEYYDADVGLPDFSDGRFRKVPGYLKRLIRPDNSVIEYDYDDNLNLARARFDDGTSTEYHYEDETYINHLTGITDRLGNRYASWEYNYDGFAVSSEHAGGVERVTLDYEMPLNSGDIGTTYVTNSEGYISTYRWRHIQATGDILLISADGPGCATCPPTNRRYSYSHDHKLITETDGAGNERHFSYDDRGRIEKIERFSVANAARMLEVRYEYDDSNLRPTRLFKPSVNSQGEYQLAISYGDDNLPIQITESGFAPTVPSETSQLASLYKPISRTTQMRYEAGRISEIDGPRNDVEDITRFRYDQLGRLSRLELPSGEHIAINKYDEHGRALEFRRAQHPTVTLQYDSHGNISKISSLGQSVSYEYNAENKLVRVTNPNGKTSTLAYDDAQRLKSVSDDLDRTVHLSLNSESKLQNRSFLGINGALISSLNYVFDAEGRIQSLTQEQQEHSSGNIISKTLDLEYDDSGKLSGASDLQSGARRSFVFNDLGQLLETIEPNGLSEGKEYDVHNRLIAQTDRKLSTTRYYRDDFGHIHFLVSPDTGVTQYRYDTAGNRTEKRNANGELNRYEWDAANRLVKKQNQDGASTYVYDAENGQLVESSNSVISDKYTYTSLTQLKSHTRIIDGNSFTTEYVYTGTGKLRNKILPDGQSLRYHYYESGPDAGTLRAITREAIFGLSQSTVLGEIDLDGRDGESSYLSHNGLRNEMKYHPDGNVASVSVSDTLKLEYDYDANGNIVGIDKNGFTQQFGYTAGQLSTANTITGIYDYQYDVAGNRIASSASGTTDDHELQLDYAAVARGNRLESLVDKQSGETIQYRYNDAGSPITIGELSYEYNTNQRPIKVTRNGNVVAEYRYNNFGERIKKVTYSNNQKKVTYYLYDNRKLVAEIDGDTLELRQTVYLKHRPVVHFIGNTAYSVHTDNLGTPKLLSDGDGNSVWEAAHTPFGKAVISKQDIQFNLRLPGQYADTETGTHYNYQRDYDPRTGRYLTSDPIGLDGGDNTYAYVNNNVLGAIDVLGLASQQVGLPSGLSLGNDAANPTLLRTANNDVQIPSTPDVSDIGDTDPNQLITDFLFVGSPCDSEEGIAHFNDSIEDLATLGLLAGTDARDLVEDMRLLHGLKPGDELVTRALETWYQQVDDNGTWGGWAGDENASLLAIPYCSNKDANGGPNDQLAGTIRGALGKLVHNDEIAGIATSFGPLDANGCRPGGIVDLTELHEEVLNRFQIELATDPRVVAAEKELILAQAALDEFNRLNPNLNCVGRGPAASAKCVERRRLSRAVTQAAEQHANALSDVYDELVLAGLLPPYDTDAAKAASREKIMLSILGIFIPLTATDAAIEATLIATTAGWGKVARMFEGVGDLFSALKGSARARIDSIIANGSEATRRADAINMQRVYGEYSGLGDLNYADVVRIESKLGADGLRKLNTDLSDNQALANAIKNKPELVNAWKIIDDAAESGVCSFDGTMEVQAKRGMVPIRDLQAGIDFVLAKDEETGRIEYKLVTDVYSNIYDKQVLISTVNDSTGEKQTVISNEIHPVFAIPATPLTAVSSEGHIYGGDIEGGYWIDAANLSIGDKLLNTDNGYSTLYGIEIVNTRFEAFNLTVSDFHTYFVSAPGSNTAYWVHNSCLNELKNPQDLARLLDDFNHNADLEGLLNNNPALVASWKVLDDASVPQALKTNSDKLIKVNRYLENNPIEKDGFIDNLKNSSDPERFIDRTSWKDDLTQQYGDDISQFSTNGLSRTEVPQSTVDDMLNASSAPTDIKQGIVDDLIKSGGTVPVKVDIKAGDELYKITPKGDGVSDFSPYWISKSELDSLRATGNMEQKLGLPLGSHGAEYDVYKITATTDVSGFTSTIAPTLQNGYTTIGGATQTLVLDRTLWSTATKVETFIP